MVLIVVIYMGLSSVQRILEFLGVILKFVLLCPANFVNYVRKIWKKILTP